MSSNAVEADTGDPRPEDVHWWNIWMSGSATAFFVGAVNMLGPMTLIPFLFQRTGINDSWLGLFHLSTLIMALSGPIGTAIAGGRRWKLPFCLQIGFMQRISFVLVPLGVMFLFDRPYALLALLVFAWLFSYFFAGVVMPVYSVVLTNGVRNDWWGRLMSVRQLMASLAGLGATAMVWAVNKYAEPPRNYVMLGWLGVGMVFVSLWFVSNLREVPLREENAHGRQSARASWSRMVGILRDDPRARWVVIGRIFRSAGFLVGVYLTAVFIERCGLTEEQMWMPVVLVAVPQVAGHLFSGWFVDRFGVKPALVSSSLLVSASSVGLFFTYSMPAFLVLFPMTVLGGSLLGNSWLPVMMKLAPEEMRPAYFSTISLAAAPGTALFFIAGIVLVQYTGFDYVFAVPAAGGLIAAAIFWRKLPHIR